MTTVEESTNYQHFTSSIVFTFAPNNSQIISKKNKKTFKHGERMEKFFV